MAILVVSNAQQILDVDFGNVTVTPVAVGPAVVGNAGDVWNMHSHPFEPLATTPNLVWSDGSPSGAGITVTNASGTWVSGSTDRMMNIYLYNFGGTAFFSVTNLPAGRYDVLVYGLGGPDEEINTRFFVQSGSTRLGPRDTIPVQGWRTLTWREGLQYVRFRNVAVASGTPLVVEASGILKSTPAVNGLQLVRLDGTAPVTIFPTGPLFTNSLTLTLSGGGQIRFTTNGMAPTPESPLYSIPFQISAATIVRAAQFSGTNQVGDEVAASYLRVYAVNDGISAAWRIQNFGAGYLTDPRAAADADPDRLRQVLSNLIENAVKYGRVEGRVTVSARPTERGRIEVAVSDDGPGISADACARIFERFYRADKARSREQGGTGLGLSIVKHVVQAHGGEVRVDSELGSGSTFYFTLAAARAGGA
jgi:anti-sigma regulatory factor (Ser/Thr protein kinase)